MSSSNGLPTNILKLVAKPMKVFLNRNRSALLKAAADDSSSTSMLAASASGRGNRITNSVAFKEKLRELFKSADTSGDGTIDKNELYSMILGIYLYIAQFTIVAAKTVPTRSDMNILFDLMDINHDGTLDFDEFECLSVMLFEDVAARITTQILVNVVAAPFLAVLLLEVIKELCKTFNMTSTTGIWANIPKGISEFLFADMIGIAFGTGLVNLIVFPYVMSLVGRMSLHHAETTSMAEQKAHLVALMSQVEQFQQEEKVRAGPGQEVTETKKAHALSALLAAAKISMDTSSDVHPDVRRVAREVSVYVAKANNFAKAAAEAEVEGKETGGGEKGGEGEGEGDKKIV